MSLLERRSRGRARVLLAASALLLVAAPAAASSAWQVTSTPNPGHNFAYQQRGIFGVVSGGTTHTYALLSYLGGTTSPTGSVQLVLHRSGTRWATSALPTAPQGNGYLESASDVRGNDVWLFGYQGGCGPAQCLWAVHHTSGGWVTATLGTPPFNLQPGVVRAFGDSDIWEVGQDALTQQPMAAHWNGTTWTTSSPALPAGSASGGLLDVARVPGTSSVVATGYAVDGQGEDHAWASRYAGGTWHRMSSQAQPPSEPARLAVLSSTDAWMVGIRWATAGHTTYKPLIEHWNGSSWRVVAAPRITGNGRLTSVAVRGSTIVAVGFRELSSGAERTLAQVRRGGSWATIASPDPSTTGSDTFYDVAHVPGTADFWAVGTEGRAITPALDRNTLAARYHS